VKLGEAAAAWAVSRRVQVGSWPVRYREAGEGPALVLAHGLGCSADYWLRNGPELAAAGYRVLAPDLPGYGRTPGPWRAMTIPEQAAALSAWADALGVASAAWVGHSISCQAVVELAARAPDRVERMVLAAPTGIGRRLYDALGLFRDLRREPISLVPWIADAYLRAGVVRWLGSWWAARRHDLVAAAARSRAPALVLVGNLDPVVTAAEAERVARAVGGTLRVIPGAAHAIIYDAAGPFNAAVLNFLRQAR
jgi:2-hydroxy-6-oxonona-2,4-dienedioate hydrolase